MIYEINAALSTVCCIFLLSENFRECEISFFLAELYMGVTRPALLAPYPRRWPDRVETAAPVAPQGFAPSHISTVADSPRFITSCNRPFALSCPRAAHKCPFVADGKGRGFNLIHIHAICLYTFARVSKNMPCHTLRNQLFIHFARYV